MGIPSAAGHPVTRPPAGRPGAIPLRLRLRPGVGIPSAAVPLGAEGPPEAGDDGHKATVPKGLLGGMRAREGTRTLTSKTQEPKSCASTIPPLAPGGARHQWSSGFWERAGKTNRWSRLPESDW